MIDLDRAAIETRFAFQKALGAVEDAYIASAEARVTSPPVGHIAFDDANGDCHIKYGHIHGDGIFVIKIATGFYDNTKKGLPSSNGMMLAFSAETGAPIAILRDEGWLTDMRTGLGGALASIALARNDFTNVLIVGAGLQCAFQAECLQKLVPDRRLAFSIWNRNVQGASEAAAKLHDSAINADAVNDLKSACGATDVIITTTPSREALIKHEWIKPGTHITAIGADSPGKQELDAALVASADLLVCDLKSQALDHGEFQHAFLAGDISTYQVIELGDVLSNAHPGRINDKQITLADLTGIAAQDIAITVSILQSQ
ncbi:MAG: ornithine cyclodeaminase family protein [Hyphomicrobiales bacterium]